MQMEKDTSSDAIFSHRYETTQNSMGITKSIYIVVNLIKCLCLAEDVKEGMHKSTFTRFHVETATELGAQRGQKLDPWKEKFMNLTHLI